MRTQAPTAGSVDLAGILLKTAAYGLLRFALPLFPNASAEFAPIAMWLGVIGIFYGADGVHAVRHQTSDCVHLRFPHGLRADCYLHRQPAGVPGAVIQMIAHGLSAAVSLSSSVVSCTNVCTPVTCV